MPDVYEGSPLLITAYLSTLPKVSLMFIIFKLYYCVFFEVFLFYQNLFIKNKNPLKPYLLSDNERFIRDIDFIMDARLVVTTI